jgi:hypothetical protein
MKIYAGHTAVAIVIRAMELRDEAIKRSFTFIPGAPTLRGTKLRRFGRIIGLLDRRYYGP